MARLAPQTLTHSNTEKAGETLDLAVGGDALIFDVGPWDELLVQLELTSASGAWSAAQTVGATYTLNGVKFHDFATPVSYTAVGIGTKIAVSGVKQVKLEVGSPSGSAGANILTATVRAYQDP